ncbi:MAG TPA: hypothetical protein VL120_01290 [Solirubrobacteraceae bacterium]|nr:hypothetical protein [Solirubrobacteraceae bacterium]
MTSRSSSSSGTSVDLTTLVLTAVASAAAAYACSKIWAPGTLASAAFTPVLVALIKEGLARPAKVVTKAVPPIRGVVRSASGPSGTEVHESLPAPEPELPDLERVAQPGEISYHSSGMSTARRWRLAIITGLLGFVIAALVFTVPELIAGARTTTYFGGGSSHSAAPVQTTTVPGQTVTQPPPVTVTQPPVVTVTAPPAATTPVPAPAVTTTTPATTTPAPAPSGAGSAAPGPAVPVPVQP